jgi:hypothetical protein
MKKLLLALVLLFSISSYAQQQPSIGHFQQLATVKRGDTIDVSWYYQPIASKDVRTFQIDFQYKKRLLTHVATTVDVAFSNQTPYIDYKQFDNYKYSNYTNGNYNYTADTAWTVARNYLILASGNQLSNPGYIIHNKYKINSVESNFASDSVIINWARLFTLDGVSIGDNVANIPNRSLSIFLKGNLTISGKVLIPATVTSKPTVLAVEDATGIVASTSTLAADGSYVLDNVEQNTKYRIRLFFPRQDLTSIRDNAVTISDGAKAYDEYTKTDVNQVFSRQYLKSGLSYLQADINKSAALDGGDAYGIYASVAGLRPIDTAGIIKVFTSQEYDALVTGANQWSSWPAYLDRGDYIMDSIGTANQVIDIKYAIVGDVNRSHSSPVFDAVGQEVLAANIIGVMNVSVPDTYADLGQPLYVPFNVSTNGKQNAALQFEMSYDPAKVKFEEILSNIQGPWLQYVTHDPQKGIIRFGGMNNQGKDYLTGDVMPFKLKFAPIGNNPMTSNIYIRKLMDASDENGDRFDIALQSEKISLSSRAIPGYYNGSAEEVTASIMPNPNNGMFELVVTFPRNNMGVDARVYDLQGRLIKDLGKISSSEYFLTASNKINVTGLRQGNYFLTLTDQQRLKVTSKQFLIL